MIWKQRSTLSCRLGRGNQLLDLCWSKGRIKHSHNVTWFLLLKSRGTGCYGNYSIDQNIKAGCKGAFENRAISLHPLKTAFIDMWQRKAFLMCGHFKGHNWKIEHDSHWNVAVSLAMIDLIYFNVTVWIPLWSSLFISSTEIHWCFTCWLILATKLGISVLHNFFNHDY